MTGASLKTAEEFGVDYSEARELIESHPEIKAVFDRLQKEMGNRIAKERRATESAKRQRNQLRSQLNELLPEDEQLEPFYD